VLGRSVDRRRGEAPGVTATRDDFGRLFDQWAKRSVEAMAELKRLSPVGLDGKPIVLKKR
jgi:hypothetical protein